MANDNVIVMIQDGSYVPGHQIATGGAICFTPPGGGCMVKFDLAPTKTVPAGLEPNSEGYYSLAVGAEAPYAFYYELAAGNTLVHYWLAAPAAGILGNVGPGHPVLVGSTGQGGR